ncbi:MAG: MCE family protein [Actinomycetes bacterium]
MLTPRATRWRSSEKLLLRTYGLVFLIVLALLAGLAVAVYQKVFTPVVEVTLLAGRVGQQLNLPAEVELHGMVVGHVRTVTTTGNGVRMGLALDPSTVGLIPGNVEASILPTTLFGEEHVDLVIPANPSRSPIRAGQVIPEDRSTTAIQVEKVLADLFPLLRSIDPAQLAATLSAMADALAGRGNALGANLARLDAYLTRLDPHLPRLTEDISRLATFATTYAAATPDLVRLLRNMSTTSATVVAKQGQLAAFIASTTGLARTADGFLTENGSRIIELATTSRPLLDLFATYSPEYPCLLGGLARFEPVMNDAWRNGRFHLTLETVPQRQPYLPGEYPSWQDTQGPNCRGLPNPSRPAPLVRLNDGSKGPAQYVSPTPPAAGLLAAPTSGWAGTAAERRIVDVLLAPQLGVPADRVPAIADLLWGPIARGTLVSAQPAGT